MFALSIFPIILWVVLVVGFVAWMWQMLQLTRQNRIIHSMTLKVLLKYCKLKGVDIDIEEIQNEVENSL